MIKDIRDILLYMANKKPKHFPIALCEQHERTMKKGVHMLGHYTAELKYDGVRALIGYHSDLGFVVYSRSGKRYKAFEVALDKVGYDKVINDKFHHSAFYHGQTLIDCEIVASGNPNRRAEIMSKGHSKTLKVSTPQDFTVRAFSTVGASEFFHMLSTVRLTEREPALQMSNRQLDSLLNAPYALAVANLDADLKAYLRKYEHAGCDTIEDLYTKFIRERDIEGLVLKPKGDHYYPFSLSKTSRGDVWYKFKPARHYVGKVTQLTWGVFPKRKREGYTSVEVRITHEILLGEHVELDEPLYVNVGSGMTDEYRFEKTESDMIESFIYIKAEDISSTGDSLSHPRIERWDV